MQCFQKGSKWVFTPFRINDPQNSFWGNGKGRSSQRNDMVASGFWNGHSGGQCAEDELGGKMKAGGASKRLLCSSWRVRTRS